MNVDATYTIEIDGHKLALTHTQAKELYRKLDALIGDGFSEIGRYGRGPYTVPCGGIQSAKPVMAPVGIPLSEIASTSNTIDPFADCGTDTYPTTPTDCQEVTIQGFTETQNAFEKAMNQLDPGTRLRVHYAIYGDGMR